VEGVPEVALAFWNSAASVWDPIKEIGPEKCSADNR